MHQISKTAWRGQSQGSYGPITFDQRNVQSNPTTALWAGAERTRGGPFIEIQNIVKLSIWLLPNMARLIFWLFKWIGYGSQPYVLVVHIFFWNLYFQGQVKLFTCMRDHLHFSVFLWCQSNFVSVILPLCKNLMHC